MATCPLSPQNNHNHHKSIYDGRRNRGPGKTANDNERIFVVHNYHDYSNAVEESFVDQSSESMDDSIRRKSGVRQSFLHTLHRVLERASESGYNHVVSWQPHGRCFVVHQPKEFVYHVMPQFFKQTKLTSFQRQLNLYGFARITRGPDSSGYYHEMFLRGKAFLCKHMSRTKVKGTKIKASSDPESEPNFYRMPPLPGTPPCWKKQENAHVTDKSSEGKSADVPSLSSTSANNEHQKHQQSSYHSGDFSNNLSYMNIYQQELWRQSNAQRQHPPEVLPPPPRLLSRRFLPHSNDGPPATVEPLDVFAAPSANLVPEPLPISAQEMPQQTLHGAFGRMIEMLLDDTSSTAL
eukprot:scaffold34638_cov161-Amphora_coffeaeformis.AAC.15